MRPRKCARLRAVDLPCCNRTIAPLRTRKENETKKTISSHAISSPLHLYLTSRFSILRRNLADLCALDTPHATSSVLRSPMDPLRHSKSNIVEKIPRDMVAKRLVVFISIAILMSYNFLFTRYHPKSIRVNDNDLLFYTLGSGLICMNDTGGELLLEKASNSNQGYAMAHGCFIIP